MKLDPDEISHRTFHLYNYHKYWLPGRIRNPNADRITKLILDLKNPAEANHTNAVQFFGRRLAHELQNVFDPDEPFWACVVPSSSVGVVSAGLISILRHIKVTYNIQNGRNLLTRTRSIPKLAHGGCRDSALHRASIRVEPGLFPPGATILLLDDVTTTGNSMDACRELLYEAGAGLVLAIALAETVDE